MSCLKLVSKVRVNRLAPSFRTKSLRSAGSVSLFFDDRCPLLQQNCGHGFQRQCRLMNTKPDSDESELLYEGPMSNMITTLKIFSLSSAVLSSFGLPALLMFRGLDLFTGVHMMMIGTTIFGSVGSTVGLNYIFSPYVYTLERISVRQCHYKKESENSDGRETTQEATTSIREPDFLLKATTRNILAMTVEHVFDPETDVKAPPRGTIRPFCSFIVKEKSPLYIHEQMIQNPRLSRNLFIDSAEPIKKQKNPDPDDEFL